MSVWILDIISVLVILVHQVTLIENEKYCFATNWDLKKNVISVYFISGLDCAVIFVSLIFYTRKQITLNMEIQFVLRSVTPFYNLLPLNITGKKKKKG